MVNNNKYCWDYAVSNLDMLKLLYEKVVFKDPNWRPAICHDQLDVIEWAYDRFSFSFNENMISDAFNYNAIKIIIWMMHKYPNKRRIFITKAIKNFRYDMVIKCVENGWLKSCDDYDYINIETLSIEMMDIFYKYKIITLNDEKLINLYHGDVIDFDHIKNVISLDIPYHIIVSDAAVKLTKYKTYKNHRLIFVNDEGEVETRILDNVCFLHLYLYCHTHRHKKILIAYLQERDDLVFLIDIIVKI